MSSPTILVATDFSPRSVEIVQKTIPLAKKLGGILHIVHVIEEGIFSSLQKDSNIQTGAKNTLKELFPSFNTEQLHCKRGKIGSSIATLAIELNVKLVVLGNSGEHGGLKNLFVGSSTKAIVRKLTVPALVVKTAGELNVDKLLIPTDLSESSKWHIHAMRSLFPKATISLLYTYIVPFSNRLSMYGVKKGEINTLGENLRIHAQNEVALFMQTLKNEAENIDVVIRESGLDAGVFTGVASMHGIQTIAIHTTGNISLFAFDLLLETDKDVLISIV